MSEQNIFSELEKFFEWYQTVYDENVYLPEKLSLPQVGERQKSVQSSAPARVATISRVSNYRQTTPEMQEFYLQIKDCQKCDLHKTRKNFVFGYGNAKAEIVFVGEAPGQEEDAQGLPFVGAAGRLLDKMLQAIGIKREDVYIANVLKCRPPKNRNPLPEEIEQCEPYLIHQLELIKPRVIVALGLFAAQTLLKTQQSLSRMRGQVHRYQDIPVIVTYHPAALLRNPGTKAQAWQDFKQLLRLLSEMKAAQ